jgi:hypothetical protein
MEAVGQWSDLERRMAIILIQRETFPLLKTHIRPGVFDVHEGTASGFRRGWSIPRKGVKGQFAKRILFC